MLTFQEESLLMNFTWRFTIVFCEGRNTEAFECLSHLLKKSVGIRFSWQNVVEVWNTANKGTAKKEGKEKTKKCPFTCVRKNMIFFLFLSTSSSYVLSIVFYSLKLQFSDQGNFTTKLYALLNALLQISPFIYKLHLHLYIVIQSKVT